MMRLGHIVKKNTCIEKKLALRMQKDKLEIKNTTSKNAKTQAIDL